MPWARTTVTVTATSGGPGADATTAVSVTIPGNHGISNSLWTDTSVGGSVGANTLALRQSQGTSTAPTTPPVAGATFVNSTVIHTVTGYTAGTRTITFTPNLTVAVTNNVSIILNPAIQIGAQAIVGTTNAVYNVRSVSNASNSVVSLYPLTGVAVPNTTAQTITFSNPIFQYGTDTTSGAGLDGLSAIRANLINAFVDHPTAGTYATTTTQIRIDDSNGAAPSILPGPFATFINGSGVHRITSYNSTTREITFSPGLTTTLADNAVLTIATQGVATNQGNAGTGVDIYTIYSTNVRINGTLTFNAWSEQLVFSASCRGDNSAGIITPVATPLVLSGTVTINGLNGSNVICPTPAIISNTANASFNDIFLLTGTGSTNSFNNITIQTDSGFDARQGTNTFTNFILLTTNNNVFANTTGTHNGFTNIRGTWNIPSASAGDYTLTDIVLDNAGTLTLAAVNTLATITILNLVVRNAGGNIFMFWHNTPVTRSKVLFLNLAAGSFSSVNTYIDTNSVQGGIVYAAKSVNHSCKNLASAALGDVKVFCADTLNGNSVNWFTAGVESAAYVRSQLSAVWDGASTRTYSWTTSTSGSATSQNVVLAYYVNPNNRAINLSAFVSNPALSGDAQIRVAAAASPTFGLFSAAPQMNGSFINNGTRHLITAVTTNGTTDYTLNITPALNAAIALNTRLLITNLYYDIRNKTNIAAFVDNAAGYNAGATTILIDNGSGARTTIQPTVNSNFIYSGTYHNITAVTPLPNSTNPTEWQLTIQPGLSASLPDNTPITLRNIAGQDFFDIDAASFPHLPQRLPDQNLAGTGTLTINWTLLDDPLIPVGTTLANARTTPATDAISFYNLAKAWWYDNFESLTAAQRNTVFVTRTGSTLNAGSYNLILNSSVSPLFNFSNSTSTITIKTNTFTDTLTTTGVITLSQPGTYSSGIVPSGGKLVIAANGTYNLTGWTFANGSTIEDTATGTVNLSLNYEATAITNNSSGITLSNTGGGTLNVTYKTNTLSAPNFAADTKAYGASIISGTETQLFSTTLASAGLTQGSIELLTGTQVRVKAAYWSNASGSWVAGNFLDTTLSWSAQSGSSVASQIGAGNPDPSVTQANRTTVEGYTSITTAAQLYDRAKLHLYDNYTATNFTSTPLVTRTGTTLNAGNYNLTLATSGSVFALSGNTITINAPTFADTLTTTGTITLNNPSTTAINYASGVIPTGGTVALAVAGTYDLSGWTFASTGAARTISNTSGGAVTVWLNPNQVANVIGSGANLSIVAKPQALAAPNLADGTRAYAARVQTFTIASTAIDTSTDTITLGNDSQGNAAAFATAAPWTQVAFRLAPGATLPATTGNVLKDGGFYYWSNNRLYTSIANIPVPPDTVGTPVDFTSQGSGNFTLQAETELFNTTVSGGSGLSQSLTQPDGILIRFKATKWSETAGNASATQFLDTRDSLITWSAFTGATVSSTLELEAVHEQIVATSYVQSGKYGQLFPAKRGDQFGSKFSIALEGVGTLQINADDNTDNPAGVELLQDIFLWACYVRSTPEGMRLWSYDTLTAINFTTYQAGRVEVENTDASVPLIIAGGSISFAGSSNGIAATSNAIYLNVDVLGVVAITGVAASDIRSAVGLSSANLDSQLGDITALVL